MKQQQLFILTNHTTAVTSNAGDIPSRNPKISFGKTNTILSQLFVHNLNDNPASKTTRNINDFNF